MPILLNCKKPPLETLPNVITHPVIIEYVTFHQVRLGGEVISDGNSQVTEYGIVAGINQNPAIPDFSFPCGFGKGSFTVDVTLNQDTTYYIRAYATNAVGTVYGNQVTATFQPDTPKVVTSVVITVNSMSAIVGGEVPYMGGNATTTHGFCWGTTHNPTIMNNITADGKGVGYFIHQISGLTPNTNYYFRAYAINRTALSYGEEIPFVLAQYNGPTVTDVDGNEYHTVTIGTQTWMVENLRTTKFRNGDPIPKVAENVDLPQGTNGYADYKHDPNYSAIYGRLYDWNVVSDSRNIAPEGWHVPSDAEWTTLTDFLINNGYGFGGSGDGIAKSMAAKSGWDLSMDGIALSLHEGDAGYDQISNNSSGFTALPGGERYHFLPYAHAPGGFWYNDNGFEGLWWSTTTSSTTGHGGIRTLVTTSNAIGNYAAGDYDDYSVRCIKD